jgi:hypothetical protein
MRWATRRERSTVARLGQRSGGHDGDRLLRTQDPHKRYDTEPISLWYQGASDEFQIGFSRARVSDANQVAVNGAGPAGGRPNCAGTMS